MAGKAKHVGAPTAITTERGLSEAQQLTLNAVRAYIATHGIPPTYRDVMRVRELASTSTVQAHFKHLQKAGAITVIEGVPRSVRVLWKQPKPLRR